MMSLVAYGSSGESGSESDEEMEPVVNRENSRLSVSTNGIQSVSSSSKAVTDNPSVQANDELECTSSRISGVKMSLHSKLPPPKTDANQEIEDSTAEEHSSLGSMLPAPKHHITPSLLQSSLVLPKGSKGKVKKGTVKIMIPSLSDFPEDEDEPKAKKKIMPSVTKSGLFALLPPPKQAPVKEANRALVPNVLTRKPAPAPPMRKAPPKVPKQAQKRKTPESDPESDGESDAFDFFSLNKEDKLPDIPHAAVDSISTCSDSYSSVATVAYEHPSSSYQADVTHQTQQYQQYEHAVAEVGLPQANSGQDFISFEGGSDLQLDDEALTKLCGRKGRNREEIQILDVSGDSIMPDQREWLTKQLTEEQPRSSSKSKLFGPSSQQKRKHQITYLAHIAKENEIELKNQWANNRQTRKQTQSKYGF